MQVQRISFKGTEQAKKLEQQKDHPMYNKKSYMQLASAGDFIAGTFATYGILETINKRKIANNKKNLAKNVLKQKAWKGTKHNLLYGLIGGVASFIAGKYINNKLAPINEKLYDKVQRLEKINQRAEELVAQEEKAQKEESSQNNSDIKQDNKPETTKIKEDKKSE